MGFAVLGLFQESFVFFCLRVLFVFYVLVMRFAKGFREVSPRVQGLRLRGFRLYRV